jgi:hypothetical protein
MSDDGSQLLLSEQSAAGRHGYDVYLRGADGSPPMLLGEGLATSLSADGRWAASVVGDTTVALLPIGAGAIRRFELGLRYYRAAPLADGGLIALASEKDKGKRFYRIGDRAEPLTPEGAWVEWQTRGDEALARTRLGEVWLIPAEVGRQPRLVTTLPRHLNLANPAPDGGWYVIERGLRPAVVRILDVKSGELSDHLTLAARDPTGYVEAATFAASADGAHHAYTYLRQLSTLFVVDGLR